MICPLCKYEPKKKIDGTCYKGYQDFAWFSIHHGHATHPIWETYNKDFYVCPECGIVFRSLE